MQPNTMLSDSTNSKISGVLSGFCILLLVLVLVLVGWLVGL